MLVHLCCYSSEPGASILLECAAIALLSSYLIHEQIIFILRWKQCTIIVHTIIYIIALVLSLYTVVLKCEKITYDVFFPDNLENHLITNSS